MAFRLQVELFRELQLLTSDYLRQRALYSLQDLVTRFLTEDSEMRQSNEPTEEVCTFFFRFKFFSVLVEMALERLNTLSFHNDPLIVEFNKRFM